MFVFAISFVRTLWRFGVELQRGIVQFLKPDLTRIEPSYGVLANQREESASVFLARPSLTLETERFEQGILLLAREFQKLLARATLAMGIQPSQSHAKRILHFGIAGHHEIDKLRYACFFCAQRLIAGNSHLGQFFDHRILLGVEKYRAVGRRPDR